MDLEGIILCEICHTEKYKCHMISLICEIKKKLKMNEYNKTTTDSKIQIMSKCLPLERGKQGGTR